MSEMRGRQLVMRGSRSVHLCCLSAAEWAVQSFHVHASEAPAVSKRAAAVLVQILVGGHLLDHPSGGQFYAPTVLVGVTPQMRIWREEVFGPVMVIVKFEDDEEAVRMANDCPFGLGSAVFSRSQRRANAIGRRLHVCSNTDRQHCLSKT